MARRTTRKTLLPMLMYALLQACGGEPTSPPPVRAPLQFIGNYPRNDTIYTFRDLVVKLTDETGRARAGVPIHFTARGGGGVAPRGYPAFLPEWRDTTDERGLAEIGYGLRCGPSATLIAELDDGTGVRDSLVLPVAPGQPASVALAPADTAAYVGNSYHLTARIVDRCGNVRPEAATIETVSGPASLDANGVVQATGLGLARFRASGAGLTEEAWVSIVPRGALTVEYVVSEHEGKRTALSFNLDGSGVVDETPEALNSVSSELWPAWNPVTHRLYLSQGPLDHPHLYAKDSAAPMRRLDVPPLATGLDRNPEPSMDGRWVYFTHWNDFWSAELWRVPGEGGAPERVGPVSPYNVHDFGPSPSPDGRAVAFLTNRQHYPATLSILDLATGEIRDTGKPGALARWSPTGQWIALTQQGQILLVRPDGTIAKTLKPAKEYHSGVRDFDREESMRASIDWSADGRWLTIESFGPALGAHRIEVIEAQTGLALRLPFTEGKPYSNASWKTP